MRLILFITYFIITVLSQAVKPTYADVSAVPATQNQPEVQVIELLDWSKIFNFLLDLKENALNKVLSVYELLFSKIIATVFVVWQFIIQSVDILVFILTLSVPLILFGYEQIKSARKEDKNNLAHKETQDKIDGLLNRSPVNVNQIVLPPVSSLIVGLNHSFDMSEDAIKQDIINLNKHIHLNEHDDVAFNNRGLRHLHLKDYQNAILDINKAIKLNPTMPVYFYNLGLVYLNSEDLINAEINFKEAIKINESIAAFHNELGLVRLRHQKFDKALKNFNRAIMLNKKLFIPFKNRAFVKYRLKKYASSIKDYSRALKIKDDDFRIYLNRGHLYLLLEDFENGIRDLTIFINQIDKKKFPSDFSIALLNRGHAYERLDKLSEALEDMQVAEGLGIHLAEVYLTNARIFFKQEKFTEAKNQIELIYKSDSDYKKDKVLVEIIKINYSLGEFDEVIALSDELLIYEPDDFTANCYRGLANVRLEKIEESIKDFEKLVSKHPDSAEGLTNLGFAKAESGDFVGARECLVKARELFHLQNRPLDVEDINFNISQLDEMNSIPNSPESDA